MNDRGLSLTPTDMLKGYLLANITTPRAATLQAVSGRSVSEHCQISAKKKTPTRSSPGFEASMLETSANENAELLLTTFDLIGTEFHRWVRTTRIRSVSG